MSSQRQTCARCGSTIPLGSNHCFRCTGNRLTQPPLVQRCKSCASQIPVTSIFCPRCGRRVDSSTPLLSNHGANSPVSVDTTTLIFQTLSFISCVLLIIYLRSDDFSRGLEFIDQSKLWKSFAAALFPSVLIFAPQVAGGIALKGRTDDARLQLVACTTGLFIGLRSVSLFLLSSQVPNNATLAGAMFCGLAGFGVVATTFPRNMTIQRWVSPDWKNFRIFWGILAGFILIQTRDDVFGDLMVFTAASIAGGSATEIAEVLVLFALPLLATNIRQSIAFTIGLFSVASWTGNMIISSDQLAWRPNPVIALCCVALMTPWQEFFSSDNSTF